MREKKLNVEKEIRINQSILIHTSSVSHKRFSKIHMITSAPGCKSAVTVHVYQTFPTPPPTVTMAIAPLIQLGSYQILSDYKLTKALYVHFIVES